MPRIIRPSKMYNEEGVICLEYELKIHIKKLQKRAILSLIATLFTIVSIGFGILFFFVHLLVAVSFFAIAIACVLYLTFSNRIAKKELKETNVKPVIFNTDSSISFKNITDILEKYSNKENRLSISEDALFFRLNKMFKLRTILYRTANFDKNDFNNAKDRINKKANKALSISPWVSRDEAAKMMRFNIIYSDTLNDELYLFISQNAYHNLTRVEGIINIAIVGSQIFLPPIYGDCDLVEVNRYKNTVKFIDQIFLGKQ